MEKKQFFKYAAFACVLGAMTTACSDDNTPGNDDNGGGNGGNTETIAPEQMQFIITSGDLTKDLKGGQAMKIMTDLTKTVSDVAVYSDNTSEDVAHVGDGFTQVNYNSESKMFTGYVYRGGANVLGHPGARYYKIENNKLVEFGEPATFENFGNTGMFGQFSYAAQVSNPIFYKLTRSGDAVTNEEITLGLNNYQIDGVAPVFSSLNDLGNNQVALAISYSNRDAAAVAIADYNLNITKVITDERIGTTGGQWRSNRYTMFESDDEGNTYIFCGRSEDNTKVGALRIKKGETEFDKDYHFDILAKSGGYRFNKVYHIGGSYFLLDCYNAADAYGNMDTTGKMAVVDVEKQTFEWVTGLPDPTQVTINYPDSYQGKLYLPVSAKAASHGGGGGGGNWGGGGKSRAAEASVTPAIYVIDPASHTATPLITFKAGELLKAITILK